MDIYAVIVLITVFILVITAAGVMTNRLVSTKNKSEIIVVCIFIFIASICEYIGAKTNGAPQELIWLHRMAKLVEFCTAPCIAIAAANAYGSLMCKKTVISILSLHVIFEIAAFFNEWVFSVDSENIYHREMLYPIYIATFVVAICFCYVCIIRGSRKYQAQFGITNILILLFLSFGIGTQMIYSGIEVDFMCVAMGSYFLYNYRGNIINQVDVTTRLLNRRCFERNIENMKSPAYVLIFDINKFKVINDTYGHNEGDKCLSDVAQTIFSIYGKYGHCYRIGGDEFCVIMHKNIDKIHNLNENFKEAIEKIYLQGEKIFGVSLGYAYYNEKETTASAALKKADEMMYKDKTERR